MHIFVTGATGFIGSHFVELAMKKGCKVTALRHTRASKPLIDWPEEPLWLEENLLSLEPCNLSSISAIAHFAATGVSPRTAPWDELEDINIRGTLRLCQLAKETGAKIAISGSYAEYGLSGNRCLFIPPNASLEPTTPYAASKAAASVISTSFARSEGIRLAYLRIFNAFGEGQYSQNLWPAMRIAALSGQDFPLTEGNQIRDFVTVEAVAHSFLSVLASTDIAPSRPLIANVGSGRPQTIREFCEAWWNRWRATGKLRFGEIPYRENEVMRFVPEIDHDLFKRD